MQVRTALAQGSQLLEQGAVASPRLTAEVLLCFALGRERTYLYSHPEAELSEVARIHYGRYLYQRLNGKPLQYITSRQEFYGRPFRVTSEVLIPRPETEHVIEVALARAGDAEIAVDIGCGSGAIGITWALEKLRPVICTDISFSALAVAKQNARTLNAAVQLANCDLASALGNATVDLVLSNPPYIPYNEKENLQREVRDHEPEVALFGGLTGVEIYQRLIEDAARVLRPGGWLVMEIGYRAEDRIRAMLESPWSEVEAAQDLAGWPRVMSARYSL